MFSCLYLLSANAQESSSKLSLSLGGGYLLPTKNSLIGYKGSRTTSSQNGASNSSDITQLYGSFGGGIGLGLTANYSINPSSSFSLGINQLMGSSINLIDYTSSTTTSIIISTTKVDSTQKTDAKSTLFYLTPSYKSYFGTGKLKFFVSIGLIVPIMGQTTVSNSLQIVSKTTPVLPIINATMTDTTYFTKTSIKTGMSIGLTASFGAELKINSKLGFFAEVRYQALTTKNKSIEYQEFTKNGTDNLSTIKFPTLKMVDANPVKDNGETLRTFSPFSSCGLFIGLNYHL